MLIVLHKHDLERNPTTWRFQPSYKSPSDDGQSLWFWQRHELFPPTPAAAIDDPYAFCPYGARRPHGPVFFVAASRKAPAPG